MISQKSIEKIVFNSLSKIVGSKFNQICYETYFIGMNSVFESIEIIQVISLIEEELEKKGCAHYEILGKLVNF